MPKQTFFNLPPEKRQTIEAAALDEFAEYGFDASNMNRIVEKSKIAKGSFYQYFENKKDLYFHLIDTVVARKLAALAPALNDFDKHSFAENLEKIFRAGLAFADSDPKYYRLGEDFVGKHPAFINEFMSKYEPLSIDVFGRLLTAAQDKGELRENLNIPLTAAFINALTSKTSENLIAQGVTKEQRNHVIHEMILFIERATLRAE